MSAGVSEGGEERERERQKKEIREEKTRQDMMKEGKTRWEEKRNQLPRGQTWK